MVSIGVLVGSLSKYSYSQKVANHLMQQHGKAKFVQINYDVLPLYNPDLEKRIPLEWQVIRSVVDEMDALLIVTQEYNLSIPGGLKNAIDVLSVPSPHPHIYQKPALVITDSSGARGGANANAHIQQLLRYIGMNVLNEFITIGNVQAIFENDKLVDEEIAKKLDKLVSEFIQYVAADKAD